MINKLQAIILVIFGLFEICFFTFVMCDTGILGARCEWIVNGGQKISPVVEQYFIKCINDSKIVETTEKTVTFANGITVRVRNYDELNGTIDGYENLGNCEWETLQKVIKLKKEFELNEICKQVDKLEEK